MVAIGYSRGGIKGVSDWPEMFATYPNPSCVRIFIPPHLRLTGGRIPQWDTSFYNTFDTNIQLLISWKVWPDDIIKWLDNLPIQRRNKVHLTYWHEPEQERDPPRTEYLDKFNEILETIADHPNRKYIKVGPIYTTFWAARPGNDWHIWWSDTMQTHCDFIGWDVYNRAFGVPDDYPSPRDPRYPHYTLNIPIASAAEVGKPYLIGEFGSRRTAADTDGSGAVKWMREMVAEMDRTNCTYADWFHYSGNDLIDTQRWPERDELRRLVNTYRTP